MLRHATMACVGSYLTPLEMNQHVLLSRGSITKAKPQRFEYKMKKHVRIKGLQIFFVMRFGKMTKKNRDLVGQSVCLWWEHSKPKGPEGTMTKRDRDLIINLMDGRSDGETEILEDIEGVFLEERVAGSGIFSVYTPT